MFSVVLLLLQESIQIAHYYLSLRFFRYVQFLFVAPCIPYDNLHFRDRQAARVYREFILDRLQKLLQALPHSSFRPVCFTISDLYCTAMHDWIKHRSMNFLLDNISSDWETEEAVLALTCERNCRGVRLFEEINNRKSKPHRHPPKGMGSLHQKTHI